MSKWPYRCRTRATYAGSTASPLLTERELRDMSRPNPPAKPWTSMGEMSKRKNAVKRFRRQSFLWFTTER